MYVFLTVRGLSIINRRINHTIPYQVALDETGNAKRMAERLNLEIRIEKFKKKNRVFDFRVPIITVEQNLLLPSIVNGD